jgi:predicted nucleic acid-binding protein
MTVLVDSNVILDVFTEDPHWVNWSSDALAAASDRSRLVINPVIFAEVSARFSNVEELDAVLPTSTFVREPIPYAAAFMAGRIFVQYRRHGGGYRSPLPDFFIGAHAAVSGYRLLTRDARRYRTYFPRLPLITP